MMNRKDRHDMENRITRLAAVQTLYALEATPKKLQADLIENLRNNPLSLGLGVEELEGVDPTQLRGPCYDGVNLAIDAQAQLEKIDELLDGVLGERWPLDKMQRTLRALLRYATYECWLTKKLVPGIVVNEAIELARALIDEDSTKVVSAVLLQMEASYGNK